MNNSNNINIIHKILILFCVSFFLIFYLIFKFLNISQSRIAHTEFMLMWIVFKIMLLIVLPVFFLIFFILYKYNKFNLKSIYKPNWSHSYKIEIIVWVIPILIVFFLSYLSLKYTHLLEPRKSLRSIRSPIIIEVISLDWRWLFIYPKYKIATINEIVIPINTPIKFKITSYSVMNSFFIPSLGSQIYSMAGMVTQLNLIANSVGKYKGISSNYSGFGFSNMKFQVRVVKNEFNFKHWVNVIHRSPLKIDTSRKLFNILESNKNFRIKYFSSISPNLFNNIVNLF
ncbi:ubiquinol oxidase subunit II [Buchnera aphidicola]|uniref:ubiquinol oxidase subunit II n=1 Tax=Buchnera aphidicola TaxID=9 RepID=UPI0031B6EB06